MSDPRSLNDAEKGINTIAAHSAEPQCRSLPRRHVINPKRRAIFAIAILILLLLLLLLSGPIAVKLLASPAQSTVSPSLLESNVAESISDINSSSSSSTPAQHFILQRDCRQCYRHNGAPYCCYATEGETQENRTAFAVGLAVGLGVPFVLTVIGIWYYWYDAVGS